MNPLRAVGDAARLGHRDEELKIDQMETHGVPRNRHCEPGGTRKMRADDRLREAIHRAA